jgi:hypothetical protein
MIVPKEGPGIDGAPPSSTAERMAQVMQDRLDGAKHRLATARRIRCQAEITGDVTEGMLENIVSAEDDVERLGRQKSVSRKYSSK